MNLEQVAYFVKHPQEMTLAHAGELKSLTEKHAYAAVYSLLYLTALANGKSVDLDSALQQHAYRLTDRTNLYHLLHAGTAATAAPPVIIVEAPVAEAIAPEPVTMTAPETSMPEPVTPEPVVEETPVAPEPVVPEAVESEEPEAAREETPVTFEQVTEAFAREQHFELDFSDDDTEEAHEEEPAVGTPVEEAASKPETALPEEPATAAQETAPLPIEGKRSFTSWLKSSQQAPTETTPAPEPEKKKADVLIDTFIKEEPSITRGKTEFFSSSRKAKESLDEDTLPVSETLAKIYAAQGNYPKAIHVYHQLMLSFPEKKSLFAVQIEALKKKITP